MQTLKERDLKNGGNDNAAIDSCTPDAKKKKSGFIFASALAAFLALNIAIAVVVRSKPQAARPITEVLKQAEEERRAAAEAGVDVKANTHSWSWWLAKYYLEQKQTPDIVLFGSSLIGSAHASIDAVCKQNSIDVLSHREMIYLQDQLSKRAGRQLSVFSLASPGEMISDSFVLYKALLQPGKTPKLVIATIAPRDFIDATLAYPGTTEHYKFCSRFLGNQLDSFKNEAYPDIFTRLQAEIEQVPLKAFFLPAWTKYAEASDSRFTAPELGRIRPGASLVPPVVVPPRQDNSAEYRRRFKKPESATYKAELRFFKSWLADMQAKGIKVLVICMPTTKSNRNLLSLSFWQKFSNDMHDACLTNEAGWLDLSTSGLFDDKQDYLDTVHLNALGAAKLFPVIADRIVSDPVLKKALLDDSEQNQVR